MARAKTIEETALHMKKTTTRPPLNDQAHSQKKLDCVSKHPSCRHDAQFFFVRIYGQQLLEKSTSLGKEFFPHFWAIKS